MKVSKQESLNLSKALRTSCCDSETMLDTRDDTRLCMNCWKPRFWIDGTPLTAEELEEKETA